MHGFLTCGTMVMSNNLRQAGSHRGPKQSQAKTGRPTETRTRSRRDEAQSHCLSEVASLGKYRGEKPEAAKRRARITQTRSRTRIADGHLSEVRAIKKPTFLESNPRGTRRTSAVTADRSDEVGAHRLSRLTQALHTQALASNRLRTGWKKSLTSSHHDDVNTVRPDGRR